MSNLGIEFAQLRLDGLALPLKLVEAFRGYGRQDGVKVSNKKRSLKRLRWKT